MRLVIEYTVGDGYTYSATETVPVVYESAEAFMVEFEQAVRDDWTKPIFERGIKMGGAEFDSSSFMIWNDRTETHDYYGPNIYTVDEWFEKC